MALTLIEAAKYAQTPLEQGVIAKFAQSSDILQVMPFRTIAGNALQYNQEETLPGIGFRGVNEAFDESVGIVNPQVESLKIAGGELDVDRFLVETQGEGMRAAQEEMKIKALSLALTRSMIKGDSSKNPKEFDGLERRISGKQLISAGSTSGGDALSLEKLDELIDQVDNPNYLVMNKAMRRLLTAKARTYIDFEQDAFGRQQTIYQGLPILIVDEDNNGNQILDFSEPNPGGGTAASTSIYCLSVGDLSVTGLQSAPISVRDMGELETKPAFRTRIEWYVSMAVMAPKGAARLRGIKKATVVD